MQAESHTLPSIVILSNAHLEGCYPTYGPVMNLRDIENFISEHASYSIISAQCGTRLSSVVSPHLLIKMEGEKPTVKLVLIVAVGHWYGIGLLHLNA